MKVNLTNLNSKKHFQIINQKEKGPQEPRSHIMTDKGHPVLDMEEAFDGSRSQAQVNNFLQQMHKENADEENAESNEESNQEDGKVDESEQEESEVEHDNVVVMEKMAKKPNKKCKKCTTAHNEQLAHEELIERAEIEEA